MKKLSNIETAANPAPIAQDNFEEIELQIFSTPISAPSGITTTIVGPPTVGNLLGTDEAWSVGDLWRDALRGLWRCTVAGDPGSWVQIAPGLVDELPDDAPDGYWVRKFTSQQYVFNQDDDTWHRLGKVLVTKSASYTARTIDRFVIATAIDTVITLPLAAATLVQELTVKFYLASGCSLAAAGSDTINGATDATTLVIGADKTVVSLVSNGVDKWEVVALATF